MRYFKITRSVSIFLSQRRKFLQIIGFLLIVSLSVFTLAYKVSATKDNPADHNVWGWAYSSNIGWISFNSCNCDNGCDSAVPEDLTSNGSNGCPPAGTKISNYGVNIDKNTGELSGYAWSSNIGWITFNKDQLVNCPSGDCKAWTDFSKEPKEINGWARACSVFQSGCSGALKTNRGDWDGWIKLNDSFSRDDPLNKYGVWAEVPPSPSPSQLRGYAWGGNATNDDWLKKAVVGWVSFNCKEGGIIGGDICASSDYKVFTSFNFNRPPSVSGLNVNTGIYCFAYTPPITLGWTFNDPDTGDYQTAYEIQIDENSSFSSPRGCPYSTDGKISAICQKKEVCSCQPINLEYSKTYYWQIKVWDSKGDESPWAVYAGSFTTLRRPPSPDFSAFTNPSAKEIVYFTDKSQCWDANGKEDDCKNNTNNHYVWNFGDGSICDSNNIDSNCRGDVTHTYNSAGKYTVSLSVTDNVNDDERTCTKIKDNYMDVQLPLPEYKEIPPTSMISKFLANVSSFFKNYLKYLM
jgi:hypothetical protein